MIRSRAVTFAPGSPRPFGGCHAWRQLAPAGRVTGHRPGAIDAADNLFVTVARPFSGTWF
ncbi:hypothetical protein [Nocardia sp. BMG51109]|uniref:hypothetical protein n=1 Tax=Nocardia sp. BMG51109 TaxID=1056816 RepID=UPI000465830B|nr:hypothetical protein [Nocardia sp. BMG51109]